MASLWSRTWTATFGFLHWKKLGKLQSGDTKTSYGYAISASTASTAVFSVQIFFLGAGFWLRQIPIKWLIFIYRYMYIYICINIKRKQRKPCFSFLPCKHFKFDLKEPFQSGLFFSFFSSFSPSFLSPYFIPSQKLIRKQEQQKNILGTTFLKGGGNELCPLSEWQVILLN